MKTLSKEEFRKKLQRKILMGRILSLVLLLGLAYSHLHLPKIGRASCRERV